MWPSRHHARTPRTTRTTRQFSQAAVLQQLVRGSYQDVPRSFERIVGLARSAYSTGRHIRMIAGERSDGLGTGDLVTPATADQPGARSS